LEDSGRQSFWTSL